MITLPQLDGEEHLQLHHQYSLLLPAWRVGFAPVSSPRAAPVGPIGSYIVAHISQKLPFYHRAMCRFWWISTLRDNDGIEIDESDNWVSPESIQPRNPVMDVPDPNKKWDASDPALAAWKAFIAERKAEWVRYSQRYGFTLPTTFVSHFSAERFHF